MTTPVSAEIAGVVAAIRDIEFVREHECGEGHWSCVACGGSEPFDWEAIDAARQADEDYIAEPPAGYVHHPRCSAVVLLRFAGENPVVYTDE